MTEFDGLPPGVSMAQIVALVDDIEQTCGLSDDPRVAASRVAARAMTRVCELEGVVQRAFSMALTQLDLPTASILRAEGGLTSPVEALRRALDELGEAAAAYLASPTEENRRELAEQVQWVPWRAGVTS